MRHERLLCEIADRWLKANALPRWSMDEVLHDLWGRYHQLLEVRPDSNGRIARVHERICWASRFIAVWERAARAI